MSQACFFSLPGGFWSLIGHKQLNGVSFEVTCFYPDTAGRSGKPELKLVPVSNAVQ